VKLEHRTFNAPSGRAVEVTTIASNYHIEVNPGDAGIYDRFVVQDLIKEMAAYSPLTMGGAAAGGAGAFKVVLLSEVDRLSKEAQAALRRTMEKYSASCRLILVATSPSKVIEPVRSRCLGVRVSAPTQQEIMAVLTATCAKEGLSLPLPVAAKVAAQSGRNLRRALLMLEAARVTAYPFNPAAPVAPMDWERYCAALAADVLREQSPRALLTARTKVYDLLVNCIPADVVIKRVLAALLEKLPGPAWEATKHELAHWAAHYEHRLQLGSKELFHIEAFLARAMATIKTPPPSLAPPPPTA
jgi:replication factor C subunit 3/5